MPTGLPAISAFSGMPSYPVYVDPVGAQIGAPYIGGNVPGIPRCIPSTITAPIQVLQWFTLTDDLTFQVNGVPGGTPLQREDRYSWAYLVRQPYYGAGSTRTTVVVYSGRSQNILGETAYTGVTYSAGNTVTVTPAAGQEPPAVRNGSWVLDATVTNALGAPEPHGFFYRVVGNTDLGGGSYQLEFETPIKATTGGAYGVLVVMDNVAEVFER
jgi:hypothetical protein